jgi:hypothetical protein
VKEAGSKAGALWQYCSEGSALPIPPKTEDGPSLIFILQQLERFTAHGSIEAVRQLCNAPAP